MSGRAGFIISMFLAVALGETLAFAQSSPWDKRDPTSPWDKPNPNSPWDNPSPSSPWTKPDPSSPWSKPGSDSPSAQAGSTPPSPASKPDAPSAHPWARVMGNWDMTFTGKDGSRIGKGHFVFHDTPGTYIGSASGLFTESVLKDPDMPCQRGRIDGADVELGCWPYGFGALKLKLSPDGNTLRGTWTNRNDGAPQGQVVFTRARPAVIERLEVLPESESRLDHSKMQAEWARGHKPQLRLRLQGRDLPIWISTYAKPKREFAIDDPDYRIVRESLSVNDYRERWKRGVVEIVVQLQPGARPGRKTLTVNGGQRTFDVAFTNYREAPKVVELKFIDKNGTPLTDVVRYGEEFFLEARFNAAPPEAQRVVKLEWSGGTRDVAVFKQKDGMVFRSAPLSLGAPPPSTPAPR